jgi:hypothetical protein
VSLFIDAEGAGKLNLAGQKSRPTSNRWQFLRPKAINRMRIRFDKGAVIPMGWQMVNGTFIYKSRPTAAEGSQP